MGQTRTCGATTASGGRCRRPAPAPGRCGLRHPTVRAVTRRGRLRVPVGGDPLAGALSPDVTAAAVRVADALVRFAPDAHRYAIMPGTPFGLVSATDDRTIRWVDSHEQVDAAELAGVLAERGETFAIISVEGDLVLADPDGGWVWNQIPAAAPDRERQVPQPTRT